MDKRHKITREQAIQILSTRDAHGVLFGYTSGAREALDMAIEALQDRPTGRWIDYSDEGCVECPFCHSATNCDGNKDELHFCFSCGAKMEGGAE